MEHASDHHHSHTSNKKALLFSFIITTAYMLIEAIGGFLTNSLALLSDAGHMLSDSLSLGIGLAAFAFGEKTATFSKTYGYKRFEILAALFNGVTLSVIAVYIIYEAIQRFQSPAEIASTGMLVIASAGLFINLFVAWILMRGDTKENLNLRAAFLHVLGDLLGSIGAITAALLILFLGWNWTDPAASLLVAVLIFISGWRVTKDAVHVLMEGTPKTVEIEEIIRLLNSVPGIQSIHDLHVWSITSGRHALSCHAVVEDSLTVSESQALLTAVEEKMAEKGIGHVTIQLEGKGRQHEDRLLCSNPPPDRHPHHH